uniref:Uncharacterized protein n=1 Tax=Arundo donax TaxID=35708 RepID=A0A0A9Q5L9_ARUDO
MRRILMIGHLDSTVML